MSSRYVWATLPAMAAKYPSDAQDKFMLRMPNGLRDRIAEVAKANNRSMNAELVARIEASFARTTTADGDVLDMHDLALELKAQIDRMKRLADEIADYNGPTVEALIRDTAPKSTAKPRKR